MTMTATDQADLLQLLKRLHRDTRVPDKAKVAKLEKKWKDDSGKWHSLWLDYLGHADVTDLLLQHDPLWNWEPVAWTDKGMPAVVLNAQNQPVGLWIRLTIHGVTRLGYGSCAPGKNDAIKELIGDAIRNAAMRFGVALQLWSKADAAGWANLAEDDDSAADPGEEPQATVPQEQTPERQGQPDATPAGGQCPECHAPAGKGHGTSCSRRNGTPAPQPAVDAPQEEDRDDDGTQLPMDRIKADVSRWLTAMRGDQVEKFITYRRVQKLPDDLKDASEDQMRGLHSWLSAQPVARVVEAGAAQA